MEISIQAGSAEELLGTIGKWANYFQSEARKQLGDSVEITYGTSSHQADHEQRRRNIGVFGLLNCSSTLSFIEKKGPLAEVTLEWQHRSPNLLTVRTTPKISNLPDVGMKYGGIVGAVLGVISAIGWIYLLRGWMISAYSSPDYRDTFFPAVSMLIGGGLVFLTCLFIFFAAGGLLGSGLERIFLSRRVGECSQFTDKTLRPIVEAAVRTRVGG